MMAVYKNKASQKVACFAYDSADGSAKTGDAANITAQISLDGAATAATNDTNPTELDATDAPGIYLFDLTQAESNGDLLVIAPVSATSGILIEPLIIYTEPELRALADDGLDEVVPAEVTGFAPTTLPALIKHLHQRLLQKSDLDVNTGEQTHYLADGSTPAYKHMVSEAGGVQTIGAAEAP